jgi:hypothetical protein
MFLDFQMFESRFKLKQEFSIPEYHTISADGVNNATGTGNLTALISQIIDKNADIGIGQITFSPKRFHQVSLHTRI